MENKFPVLQNHTMEKIRSHEETPCWRQEKFPTIKTTIAGIENKGIQADSVRRNITLEEIETKYPSKEWTHIYTDGSAEKATANGGAGICIKYKNNTYLST